MPLHTNTVNPEDIANIAFFETQMQPEVPPAETAALGELATAVNVLVEADSAAKAYQAPTDNFRSSERTLQGGNMTIKPVATDPNKNEISQIKVAGKSTIYLTRTARSDATLHRYSAPRREEVSRRQILLPIKPVVVTDPLNKAA